MEKVQKEKQGLLMELENEAKRSSSGLEKLEKQKEIINNLNDEVTIQKNQCERLKEEKSQILNEAKEKEKRFKLECKEVFEKSHSQNKSLECTLLHLKSELSLSQSLRNELEQKIARDDEDFLALQDQNIHLQEKVGTLDKKSNEFCDREVKLIAENTYLNESLKNASDESKRLKNCYENVQHHLETIKTTLSEKEQENDTLQKKLLSNYEIINELKQVTLNSKSEINHLKCNAIKNTQKLERINKELVHERNTVSTLIQDKTNIEELFRRSQNLETNLKNDLEKTKLQVNDIRNENLSLKKENRMVHSKLDQEEKSTQHLKSDIQTLSVEKLKINDALMETARDLDKANEDLYQVCSTVSRLSSITRIMLNENQVNESAMEISCAKEDENSKPSCLSPNSSALHVKSTTNTVIEELGSLENSLKGIDSILKQLVENETTLKNNISELNLMNKRLQDQHERQQEEYETLNENQKCLLQKNDHLEAENRERTKLCEKLKGERSRAQELLSNECTTSKEISKELTILKEEKQRLLEKNKDLTKSRDEHEKDNVDLNAKNRGLELEIQGMCEKYSSLKRRYTALYQEKREIDEKALTTKEQIHALENDLEASVQYSDLLEKRYAEESENNTNLRLQVEMLGSQVSELEENLKTSLNDIEEKNSKIMIADEEIRQTAFLLREKEQEIARLSEELTNYVEKLKNCTVELENHKTAHERVKDCKKESEERLERTELLLKRSETMLNEEKHLRDDLEIKKNNTETNLQSTIIKLQERVDELISNLSTTNMNKKNTEENLDAARQTIQQLEKDVQEQQLKINENEEKINNKDEELEKLQINFTNVKFDLDEMCKLNEKAHEETQNMQKLVKNLETEANLQNHLSLKKVANMEKQLSNEKKAKESLQNEIASIQEEVECLTRQNSEKVKQMEGIMESKTAEICQLSEKLTKEIYRNEELQSNLNAARLEKKSLEQKNEDVAQEIYTTFQFLVNDLKSTEFEQSFHSNVLEDSNAVSGLFKVIEIFHSSHTQVKDLNNSLTTKVSELNERLQETTKNYETLLTEKTHLEDVVHSLQKESETFQTECHSLAKAFATCQQDIKLKGDKVETLEGEVNEYRQQEKCLQETIIAKEKEYLVLHTKKELIDEKSISLETEVAKLKWKLGNTIIELKNASTSKDDIERRNSELIITNSRFLDDQVGLQNEMKAIDDKNKILLEKLSLKENELARLKTETDVTKNEMIAIKKCLEEKEAEFLDLKNNLNELQKRKYDLENERDNLRKLNEQLEKDNEDLQLTSSRIQEDNSQLRREHKCLKNENLKKTTHLQSELEKALTTLEKQQREVTKLHNEKGFVQNQLLEAEKELRVLMEDNALVKQLMYQSKPFEKDEV